MNICCGMMKQDLERKCEKHANRSDCPDNVIHRSIVGEQWGLMVHDGGASFYRIYFCPWCGKKLADEPTEELDLSKDLKALVDKYHHKLTASVLTAVEELVEACEGKPCPYPEHVLDNQGLCHGCGIRLMAEGEY